jgi:hypothetical protein
MRSHCIDLNGETPQIAAEYPSAEFVGPMTPEKALQSELAVRMRERGRTE